MRLGDRVRYKDGKGEGIIVRSCRPHYTFLMNNLGEVWLVQFPNSTHWMAEAWLEKIEPTQQLTLFDLNES